MNALGTKDPAVKQHVASILAELPAERNDQLFDQLKKLLDAESDPLTSRHLLHGLVRQSETLPDKKRIALVGSLIRDGWIDRLGKQPVLFALAEIGGKEAEDFLLQNFDQSMLGNEAGQKRDAVDLLLRLKQPAATGKLLDLARDPKAPEYLRKLIHSGVGHLPHDEKIDTHLMQVIQNKQLSPDERIEAVKSLNKIQKSLDSKGLDSGKIRDALKDLLKTGVDDAALQKSLKDSLDDDFRW